MSLHHRTFRLDRLRTFTFRSGNRFVCHRRGGIQTRRKRDDSCQSRRAGGGDDGSGIEIAEKTFKRYGHYKKRILEFLNFKYQLSDIQIDQIKYSFALQYEHYLKSVVKLHQNSLVKFLQYLCRVLDYGVKYDYLVKLILEFLLKRHIVVQLF